MRITLSSDSPYFRSQSSKIMTPEGEENKKRVQILNEYNSLVRKEAAAVLKKDKAAEKEANKARTDFMAKLKADGIPLPRSAGRHAVRLSVDGILKGASNRKDFEKPSVLKNKEDGNVLVESKFAKQILPNLTTETSKKLASLDKSDQVNAVKSVESHLARLKSNAKGVKVKEVEKLLAGAERTLAKAKDAHRKAKDSAERFGTTGLAARTMSRYISARRSVDRLKNSLKFHQKKAEDAKAVLAKMDTPEGHAKVIDAITNIHVNNISQTNNSVKADRMRRLTKPGKKPAEFKFRPTPLTKELL